VALLDGLGWTPRDHALFRGHIEVAAYLLPLATTYYSPPANSSEATGAGEEASIQTNMNTRSGDGDG
jgi:ankyrin repeat protein